MNPTCCASPQAVRQQLVEFIKTLSRWLSWHDAGIYPASCWYAENGIELEV
jgi:hypothetical protein